MEDAALGNERPPAPQHLGLVGLVKWAWKAYKKARDARLLELDPGRYPIGPRRKKRRSPRYERRFYLLIGLALSVALSLGIWFCVGLFARLSFRTLDEIDWAFLILLSMAVPCGGLGSVHVFTHERQRSTFGALVMTPLPRQILVMMRFALMLRGGAYLLLGSLPGYLAIPALAGGSLVHMLAGAAAWLLALGLTFALCTYGVAASVRHRSMAKACLDVLAQLGLGWMLIVLRLFFGSVWRAFLTVCLFAAYILALLAFTDASSMEPPLWLQALGPIVLFGILASQLLVAAPLRALREAALRFDEWALRD